MVQTAQATPCRRIGFTEIPTHTVPAKLMLFQYSLFDLCSLSYSRRDFGLDSDSLRQPPAAPRTHSTRSYWLTLHDSTLGCRSRNRQHAISMADDEHTVLPHPAHPHVDGLQTLEARGHGSRAQHVRQGREECVLSYCVYGPMLL